MINFEFGTKVKAFAKLGLQKHHRWVEGIYLGDNAVEFWTGTTETFPDKNIKKLIRIEHNVEGWPELDVFVNRNWDKLKKTVSDCMLKFFPDRKIEFNDKEHFIICEGYTIGPAVVEVESFCSFTEVPVWQLTFEVHSLGSYWEPPDVDVQELEYSLNEDIVAGHLLNRIWNDTVSSYWENVSYSKMAEESNSNLE